MNNNADMLDDLKLKRRYHIRGEIQFETAWRIGSGREGQTMSDLGVMLDPEGLPSCLVRRSRGSCGAPARCWRKPWALGLPTRPHRQRKMVPQRRQTVLGEVAGQV